MSHKKDILTDALRDRLRNYEHPVPDDLWNKIEKDMPRISFSRKIPLCKIMAAAAGIALLVGIGFFFANYDFRGTDIISEQTPVKDSSDISSEQPVANSIEKQQITSEQITEAAVENNDNIQRIKASQKIIEQNIVVSEQPKENLSVIRKEDPSITNKDNNKSGTNNQEIKKERESTPKQESSKTPYRLPNINRTNKKNLSFALAVGNGGSLSFNNRNMGPYYCMGSPSVVNEYLNQDQSKNNTNNTEIDYKMPLSVGLSIRKHFSEKWALESGLIYTYLSSTERKKAGGHTISKRDIDLNYVGIPVKGVYSFYNTKDISVYASAGGMVEKSIYGKETIDDEDSNTLNISEFQWSVFGNVGVNYRIVNHLGLFIEPGVGYYFNDGSNVETIRKDSPFNFNIQVGIRLTY